MAAKRIRWSDEDLEKLRVRYYELKEIYKGGGQSDLDLIREAQRILPPGKQRNLYQKNLVEPALKYIKRDPEVPKKELPPPPTPEPSPSDVMMKALMPFIETVANILADRFAQKMAATIEKATRTALADTLDKTPADVIEFDEAVEKRQRLPKIGIFGLDGEQEERLRHDYDGIIDMKFWGGGKSRNSPSRAELGNSVRDRDLVIVLANRVKHSDIAIMKKNVRVQRLWGGYTTVREFLDDLMLKERTG